MKTSEVQRQVETRRRAAGLSLTALAAMVGVSRQALSAVESGRSTPSTTVALKLARALHCTVEQLFSLAPETPRMQRAPGPEGPRVVAGKVGTRWIAHGLNPRSTRPADGLLVDGKYTPLHDDDLAHNALLAGCAPPLGTLVSRATPHGRASWIYAPSGRALRWLAQGLVHVAGMHLTDLNSPGLHDAMLRQAMPHADVRVISLLNWRQGLVMPHNNPMGLHSAADLQDPAIRIAARQAGSGAARVLERAMTGLARTAHGGPTVRSHLEAAQAVSLGAADVAVAIEPVAHALGLCFLPLSEERFELAVRAEHLHHPGVVALLDRLATSSFAQEVAGMGAYDLSLLGDTRVVAA